MLFNAMVTQSISLQLQDDDGANELTKDWTKVGRVCQRHHRRKTRILSAIAELATDGQRTMRQVNPQPPNEESSMWKSAVLNMKAFIREAYESLKVQVEAKVEEEKVTSQQMQSNDAIDIKTKVRYNDSATEKVWNTPSFLLATKRHPRIRLISQE